ncbi:efflux transporter outer membrane subunit [Luteibacter aegosomaticola]|uniref:TolC family protein n=1 Tax=Luteibacter aegosomaticola TaxID=2911538 RepID=UPI001FFB0225|nr:efflux transporter outer membrane subunit [Luteibacter aegosomaticola]UPG90381.1 efflux transporter outer membrane subunit [Luteibacter aegosomaticola]
MKWRVALSALAAALVAAGCTTVGPDYKVPDNAMVKDPRANGAFLAEPGHAVDAGGVLRDDWWRLYDDPTLDALERQALQANIGLRVADANLRRAGAMLAAAEAEHEVTAKTSATAQRTLISAQSYLEQDKLPTFNVAVTGIEASYDFDLFGKLQRGVEAASADTEAATAARDLVRVTVAAQVASSYVGICESAHDLEIADRTVQVQQRGADVAKRLFDAGLGNRLDVTRATAQLDLARSALPPLQRRHEASQYALAALLGHVPGDIPDAAKSCSVVPEPKQPIPVGDGMALLKRRPDIREAERKLAAATARIGVATAELYPSVSLGASLGTNGLLADYGQAPQRYWSIGPLISWTIPTRSAKERVEVAKAGADVALASFDQTVIQALKETQTALSDYAHALDREETLRQALGEATTASKQAADLYHAGRTPYLSALDAERTRVAAETALTDAESAVSEARIHLFYALGGGWQDGA